MAGIDDPHHMARGPCGGKILREGHGFFFLALAPRGICLQLCMSSPSQRPTLFILFFNLCLEAWLLCIWDWGCWVGGAVHAQCSSNVCMYLSVCV